MVRFLPLLRVLSFLACVFSSNAYSEQFSFLALSPGEEGQYTQDSFELKAGLSSANVTLSILSFQAPVQEAELLEESIAAICPNRTLSCLSNLTSQYQEILERHSLSVQTSLEQNESLLVVSRVQNEEILFQIQKHSGNQSEILGQKFIVAPSSDLSLGFSTNLVREGITDVGFNRDENWYEEQNQALGSGASDDRTCQIYPLGGHFSYWLPGTGGPFWFSEPNENLQAFDEFIAVIVESVYRAFHEQLIPLEIYNLKYPGRERTYKTANRLKRYIEENAGPEDEIITLGFSQGALALSYALSDLNNVMPNGVVGGGRHVRAAVVVDPPIAGAWLNKRGWFMDLVRRPAELFNAIPVKVFFPVGIDMLPDSAAMRSAIDVLELGFPEVDDWSTLRLYPGTDQPIDMNKELEGVYQHRLFLSDEPTQATYLEIERVRQALAEKILTHCKKGGVNEIEYEQPVIPRAPYNTPGFNPGYSGPLPSSGGCSGSVVNPLYCTQNWQCAQPRKACNTGSCRCECAAPSATTPKGQCQRNSDCAANGKCLKDFCTCACKADPNKTCTADWQCGSGTRCEGNCCVPIEDETEPVPVPSVAPSLAPLCGNTLVDPGEECDFNHPNGTSCVTASFNSGFCQSDCTCQEICVPGDPECGENSFGGSGNLRSPESLTEGAAVKSSSAAKNKLARLRKSLKNLRRSGASRQQVRAARQRLKRARRLLRSQKS